MCAHRLQIRRKCNRQGEISGAMMVTVIVRLNWSLLHLAPPLHGGCVLRVVLPNAEFELGLY